MSIRKSSFSGSWYPESASECEEEIAGFLKDSRFQKPPQGDYIGGIVPHAGWYFSGSLACNVISAISSQDTGKEPDAVVVFGMHMHPNSTPCIMTEGAWETPFGNIDIEREISAQLTKKFPFNVETANRFTQDNTIELQLPFVKYFFPGSKLIPVGVPPSEKALAIARSIVDIANQTGKTIKVIGSTDLTHYGSNYGFSPKGSGRDAVDWVKDHNDQKAIDLMLDLNPEDVIAEGLASQNACCSGAAASAIESSKVIGAKQAHFIGYSSSYEKHPGESFVGYAGIVYN